MFGLWSDLFNEAFKFSARNSSAETSLESLVLRLGQLINMSAVDAVNGDFKGIFFVEFLLTNVLLGLFAQKLKLNIFPASFWASTFTRAF